MLIVSSRQQLGRDAVTQRNIEVKYTKPVASAQSLVGLMVRPSTDCICDQDVKPKCCSD